jgi:uncharacterized YccA/Bax inhibitor family protein
MNISEIVEADGVGQQKEFGRLSAIPDFFIGDTIMMRTGNPALNAKTFTNIQSFSSANNMTIQGTVNKTGFLLVLLALSAGYVWNQFFTHGSAEAIMPYFYPALGGAFIVGIITVFKKEWAKITAPIYAILEGLLLGGISAIFEAQFPGIVMQAVGLTFGTLFALLLAYKSGVIRATENFKLGVVAATGGIAVFYLVSIVMGFFGFNLSFMHDSSLLSIGISVFIVVIAALNLVLDFDFIEHGAESGAPKYMEWYAAFGLLVTLIWLYLEILRLLAKLQSRR